MNGQVESILEELYNDISINKEDKDEMENSCNNFMLEELEKIKITLSIRMNEFCLGEMKKMKDKKMDRFNKNMNDITINTCRFIAKEFKLVEEEVIEQNKDNLLKINNYHEVYKQNYIEDVIEDNDNNNNNDNNDNNNNDDNNDNNDNNDNDDNNDDDDDDDNDDNDDNDDDNDEKTKNPFEIKKTIVLDSLTENDDYKKFLISKNKCPAFIKGKYCCKPPKPKKNHCGYHKRFEVE